MEENINSHSNIDSYILQGEELLWKGKPVKPIKLLPGEKFNIILGIFWTVFSVFWVTVAIVSAVSFEGDGFAFVKITPFFGIPMLLFGIYLILIYPLMMIKKRKNIEYALTNRRILILSGEKTQTLMAFKYSEIQNISFGCDEEEIGALTFVNAGNATTTSSGTKKAKTVKGVMYGFYNIPEVKKVYEIFCKQTGEKQI